MQKAPRAGGRTKKKRTSSKSRKAVEEDVGQMQMKASDRDKKKLPAEQPGVIVFRPSKEWVESEKEKGRSGADLISADKKEKDTAKDKREGETVHGASPDRDTQHEGNGLEMEKLVLADRHRKTASGPTASTQTDRKDTAVGKEKKRAYVIEKLTDEKIARMRQFVKEMTDKGIAGLIKEYDEEVKPYKPPGGYKRKVSDDNKDRNRYRDIICEETTRVILKGANDYIHANYVRGKPMLNSFICTQGPLPNTIVDFWRMILQEKIGQIFMLCQLKENKREKSATYYPAKVGETMTFGEFVITCLENENRNRDGHVVSRLLKVEDTSKTMEPAKVKHLNWITWPDCFAPKSLMTAFSLLQVSRRSRFNTVVHCSAGIGRTGSFVMLEMILTRILFGPAIPNIVELLKDLRGQRAHSIQTDVQYIFVVRALVQYAKEKKYLSEDMMEAFKSFSDDYDNFLKKKISDIGKRKKKDEDIYQDPELKAIAADNGLLYSMMVDVMMSMNQNMFNGQEEFAPLLVKTSHACVPNDNPEKENCGGTTKNGSKQRRCGRSRRRRVPTGGDCSKECKDHDVPAEPHCAPPNQDQNNAPDAADKHLKLSSDKERNVRKLCRSPSATGNLGEGAANVNVVPHRLSQEFDYGSAPNGPGAPKVTESTQPSANNNNNFTPP